MKAWRVVLLVAVGLVACACTGTTGRNGTASTSSSSSVVTGRSALAQQIDELAVINAAASGDSHPTEAIWVATNAAAGQTALSGDTGFGSTAPVYAVEVLGKFTLYAASYPPGGGPPTGTVLKFEVMRTYWEGLGGGVGDKMSDFHGLGTVHTDSLSGVAG